ncbi:nucleotidyl transferase AbiEii/AbiGii toxin family protein [Salegentibacter sp. F188]|uniref:Nucleotidyl transferase AbiEii/AbiGii toxin family protein n=1 Tax=Autumnicola patrickiae TaxID=3075591 RepID=A0ABU3E3R8_9FLAO|nr:nucleotidyl transferase AbiEii/AbiGii toxin family protein [Salegentibacter sp. F188]MDT0690329.1 nucleotidyl transferase AbiEii/AbiGii toxin family protein [Salegentibacter sp. F188]
MLKNTLINRIATKRVAVALGDLNEKVIFVGGAMISLYIDDPAAEDVRPTKDIDITFKIVSTGELEELREILTSYGFSQSPEDDVICRFRLQDIKVDVMSTKEVGWAPANPWFEPGFEKAFPVHIEDKTIKILPLPYFLATKFSAFTARGGRDPRMSHDFEDIVYLLNYTSNFRDEIMNSSDEDVQKYLVESFQKILENKRLQEAIIGNLYFEDRLARFERIMQELKATVNGI